MQVRLPSAVTGGFFSHQEEQAEIPHAFPQQTFSRHDLRGQDSLGITRSAPMDVLLVLMGGKERRNRVDVSAQHHFRFAPRGKDIRAIARDGLESTSKPSTGTNQVGYKTLPRIARRPADDDQKYIQHKQCHRSIVKQRGPRRIGPELIRRPEQERRSQHAQAGRPPRRDFTSRKTRNASAITASEKCGEIIVASRGKLRWHGVPNQQRPNAPKRNDAEDQRKSLRYDWNGCSQAIISRQRKGNRKVLPSASRTVNHLSNLSIQLRSYNPVI